MALLLVLYPMVYIFLSKFALLEHLVNLMILIIEIKFKLLNFLSKGTVIIKYVKHFLSFIAVILN